MTWNPNDFETWCDKADGKLIEESPEPDGALSCQFKPGAIPTSVLYDNRGKLTLESTGGVYLEFDQLG